MGKNEIIIKGARENNLKEIDLTIPRDKLIVFTGVSGSGKSSLAFDTIFADGQRRYMESLSSYARQFLGQMEKPDVDDIQGLSPAISIDQKTTSKNPRSTVGTVTEIYDYLRLLYARIGIPHCPVCGREIKQQTIDQIVDKVLALPKRAKIQILAPIVRGRKGEHVKEFEFARKNGFIRVRVDGELYDLSEEIKLEKNKKHNIEIVVDRLIIDDDIKSRLTDSLEIASKISGGLIIISMQDAEDILFSQEYACPEHEISIEELTPRMFSFNNPYGACEVCTGIGTFTKVDPLLIIPNEDLSIKEGAIKAPGWTYNEKNSIAKMYYDALAKKYKFSLDTPFGKLPKNVKNIILYGTKGQKLKISRNTIYGSGSYEAAFEGIINNLERRYKESTSEWAKEDIAAYMNEVTCPHCNGERLKKTVLGVTVGGKNISQFTQMSITQAVDFIKNIKLTDREKMISGA
ncbi:MAG: excinuclease ABC subunit UvrA, partial [Oscillospiraceae bacterium]|nr:excinuclease ABC subunit UvrA [Oscillospiraceae bacterium]